jgi:hypothetical protein
MRSIILYTQTIVCIEGYDFDKVSLLAYCYNAIAEKRFVGLVTGKLFLEFPSNKHVQDFIEAVKELL